MILSKFKSVFKIKALKGDNIFHLHIYTINIRLELISVA